MKCCCPIFITVAISAVLHVSPTNCSVLFSETGTPDAAWSDDGDANNWMIGFTEQDVINAGWSGTDAETAWQLDLWHSPENKVLAISLLNVSPDKADTQDSLVSSLWADRVARADVPWTLFCSVAVLYDIEPGFTDTLRLDLKAQGEIADSVRLDMSGSGFSNWLFMAGSIHEPIAEIAVNHWEIQVSVAHLAHAKAISVMVDDISVYESEYIDPIVGRIPDPGATPGIEIAATLDPLPLPTLSTDDSENIILTWRSTEGYTYGVERKATKSFTEGDWEKIAEGLPHDPSETITFYDEGAVGMFDAAYYRVVVHAP
jgi:hypothetical protein